VTYNHRDESLADQIEFLLGQLRVKAIDLAQFMQLLGMAYGDYLEFHSEEHPVYDRSLRDE